MVENTVVIKMEVTYIINDNVPIEIIENKTAENMLKLLSADDVKIISTKVFPREVEE